MSFVSVASGGLWMPYMPGHFGAAPTIASTVSITLDADEEEGQFIGRVTIDGGGSKTFGTSSKLGWLVGSSPTFGTGATVRLGVKQASSISTTAGPPARATIGAASFDVWGQLVGGTTTLTPNTWREDAMTAGTPFTVSNGDLLAVCFHLDLTSGTQLVPIAGNSGQPTNTVTTTLVTAGPTYTGQINVPAVLLLFDDGAFGWLEPCRIYSVADLATPTIGIDNSIANIIEVPFPCQIDTLAAFIVTGAGTGDYALELVGTPFGTPTVVETFELDANIMSFTTGRFAVRRLPTPRTLEVNTPYALSVKQTTASAVTCRYWEVPNTAYFRVVGDGITCYAANSTGGVTFVTQNSGLRRYLIWMGISALDDGTGGEPSTGGGGSVFGAVGGVIS